MWHATFTHVIHGNFIFLVVENQINTLTPSFFVCHNLCCKYSNGSWEPILDIYVLRTFQWYKELFNQMSFDPSNCFLKIHDFIGFPTPKVGVHLGVWALIPSHFLAFLGVWMWLPGCTIDPHLLCPCFGCELKAKVMTITLSMW
jgi:hypothetical protein